MDNQRFRLQIDLREKGSCLAALAADCDLFETSFQRLRVGDYIVNGTVLIERKSAADFAVSIVDGRLFRQARAMARTSLRTLFLIESPGAEEACSLHPHALFGACISLALMWRQPVIFSRNPEESLLTLRLAAEQTGSLDGLELIRCGYRPKRMERRKLFVLQGLPGVGPKLAASLLSHFGSVENVMKAGVKALQQVRGCGPKKAAALREVLG